MRILVLGDIDCRQQELEADWVNALRGYGHDVAALLPGLTFPGLPPGVAVTSARGIRRFPDVVALARRVRPELVVAFNPINLCFTEALRPLGLAPAVHYHAHEVFTGSLSRSPIELAAQLVAHRADWVSVPLYERALVVQATHRLPVQPTVVANLRGLRPSANHSRSRRDTVVIADQARWLTDTDVARIADGLGELGWQVVVTGRGGLHAAGMLGPDEYRRMSQEAVAAVSITRPASLNFVLAASYRIGWFLSCGVPQVVSEGSYVKRFVESGAAVAVSPWADGDAILEGLSNVHASWDAMRRAAFAAFGSWGNLEAELRAVPWACA